jgi:hypothetical protein
VPVFLVLCSTFQNLGMNPDNPEAEGDCTEETKQERENKYENQKQKQQSAEVS